MSQDKQTIINFLENILSNFTKDNTRDYIRDYIKDNTIDNNDHEFWKIGKSYFVRTVTMHSIGLVSYFDDKDIVFEKGAWVADSGRFNEALKSGSLEEVEPFEDKFIINRSSIVDATVWNHSIPTKVK